MPNPASPVLANLPLPPSGPLPSPEPLPLPEPLPPSEPLPLPPLPPEPPPELLGSLGTSPFAIGPATREVMRLKLPVLLSPTTSPMSSANSDLNPRL